VGLKNPIIAKRLSMKGKKRMGWWERRIELPMISVTGLAKHLGITPGYRHYAGQEG
jgi:hypothetical protein